MVLISFGTLDHVASGFVHKRSFAAEFSHLSFCGDVHELICTVVCFKQPWVESVFQLLTCNSGILFLCKLHMGCQI